MALRKGEKSADTVDSDWEELQYTPRMLAMYFALAFALTWSFVIPAMSSVPQPYRTFFIIAAAFGPFVSALITIQVNAGGIQLRRWLRRIFRPHIPVVLYLAGAFLLPGAIAVLHYGIYRLLGGEPDFSEAIPWYLYLLYLIPTALLTGGNEEPGWRGFALPGLLRWFHPLLAGIILGAVHSAWHLPLMSHYDTTFGWYLFNLIPLTVILNWLYLKSRRSVIPVMLLHAGTNVVGSFVPTPTDVLGGLGDYMFLRGLVYWGMAVFVIIATKGRLGCPERRAQSLS